MPRVPCEHHVQLIMLDRVQCCTFIVHILCWDEAVAVLRSIANRQLLQCLLQARRARQAAPSPSQHTKDCTYKIEQEYATLQVGSAWLSHALDQINSDPQHMTTQLPHHDVGVDEKKV